MPRTVRKGSESGFYHIVTKGDGSQVIFEGERDRARYLALLEQATSDHEIEVHAYCLMSNHVHLLIRDENQTVSAFMKQLDERYAMYFAHVSNRVGHVFQGRFWSEPIVKDEHFLSTLRYIHANPEPAGICRLDEYPWSSYRSYLEESPLVTTDMAFSLLGGPDRFAAFSTPGGRYVTPFPGSNLKRHLSPDELVRVASEILGDELLRSLRTLAPEARHEPLRLLAEAGFTTKEMSRVTGLGYSSIQHALQLGT